MKYYFAKYKFSLFDGYWYFLVFMKSTTLMRQTGKSENNMCQTIRKVVVVFNEWISWLLINFRYSFSDMFEVADTQLKTTSFPRHTWFFYLSKILWNQNKLNFFFRNKLQNNREYVLQPFDAKVVKLDKTKLGINIQKQSFPSG